MLSAVNLPGGVQRRRTYEDELNMREFFEKETYSVQRYKSCGTMVPVPFIPDPSAMENSPMAYLSQFSRSL